MEPMTSMWKITVWDDRTGDRKTFMVQGDNRSRVIDNAREKMQKELGVPYLNISFEEPEFAFEISWRSLNAKH